MSIEKSRPYDSLRYIKHGDHSKPDRIWHQYYHCATTLKKFLRQVIVSLKLKNSETILDFGCSTKPYQHYFPDHCNYIGADIPGNQDAAVHILADGRLPIETASVDVVLSTQVLEHVSDPHLYLTESMRVLKKGGRLILSTHGLFVYHPDPVDYWRWTSAGLRKLVEDAGFKIVGEEGLVGAAAAALQFFQDSTSTKLPWFLSKFYFVIFQLMIMLADWTYKPAERQRDAWDFTILAIKP
jgi:SAM-dependent methyltransferase